ncbi:MAG: hypothetical protein ACP5J5_06465, partial [Dissulfurimicrobium sp.]
RLDTAKDSELVKAFERLENERIGAGKHEEFHEFLHELDHEYLGWGGRRQWETCNVEQWGIITHACI